MEDQVTRLVQKVYSKTTLAKLLTHNINALCSPEKPAILMPMDGFHLTRAQLQALPDPEAALFFRGAPFTFDAAGWCELVTRLRAAIESREAVIEAPSFDHAIKDPVYGDIRVLPAHRVVVMEGLYLALDRGAWAKAAAMLDELWFVDVDGEVALRRVAARHVAAGIARDEEDGLNRARNNDMVNGKLILENKVGGIVEIVSSKEDVEWRPYGRAQMLQADDDIGLAS